MNITPDEQELKNKLYSKIHDPYSWRLVHDLDTDLTGDAMYDIMNLITLHTNKSVAEAIGLDKTRNKDITPDDMLLAQNKRLIEAGDTLYERASYTGREFDGTHRLLSAAANWLDVRGKNSGEYQTRLKENKQ